MAESSGAQVQRMSLLGLVRGHDVESRTICRLNLGLESASLLRYITGSASKRTPPC
jgi:hypothetical protein